MSNKLGTHLEKGLAVTSANMYGIADSGVGTNEIADNAVTTAKIAATGTPDSTTFLRGDDTWAVPAGGGGAGPYDVVVPVYGGWGFWQLEKFKINVVTYEHDTALLPTDPATGDWVIIKVMSSWVASQQVQVYPTTGTIDDHGQLILNTDHAFATIVYNGTQWMQTSFPFLLDFEGDIIGDGSYYARTMCYARDTRLYAPYNNPVSIGVNGQRNITVSDSPFNPFSSPTSQTYTQCMITADARGGPITINLWYPVGPLGTQINALWGDVLLTVPSGCSIDGQDGDTHGPFRILRQTVANGAGDSTKGIVRLINDTNNAGINWIVISGCVEATTP